MAASGLSSQASLSWRDLSGGCRMSSAPVSWLRGVRKSLLAGLAVLFCLATAAALGTWWLWPPQPYVVLPGSDSATHIQFSRDGTLLAACSKEDTILVWETAAGR